SGRVSVRTPLSGRSASINGSLNPMMNSDGLPVGVIAPVGKIGPGIYVLGQNPGLAVYTPMNPTVHFAPACVHPLLLFAHMLNRFHRLRRTIRSGPAPAVHACLEENPVARSTRFTIAPSIQISNTASLLTSDVASLPCMSN